jgi:hypothetical protein
MAQNLKRVTRPGAKVGIVLAGTTPYYNPDGYFIDLLGKNEPMIARENAHIPSVTGGSERAKYTAFWPGHMKWDYAYVIEKYHPDIFAEVYPDSEVKYLLQHGYHLRMVNGDRYYIRTGTTQVTLQ